MKPTSKKANALREQGESKKQNTQIDNTSNSAADQRVRAYARLKAKGSATTIELRDECDIMMPAARIHELRHKHGHNIATIWVHQPTACGKLHRVAQYVLVSSQPSLFD